jgi:hypothetical protein
MTGRAEACTAVGRSALESTVVGIQRVELMGGRRSKKEGFNGSVRSCAEI